MAGQPHEEDGPRVFNTDKIHKEDRWFLGSVSVGKSIRYTIVSITAWFYFDNRSGQTKAMYGDFSILRHI